MNLLLVGGSHKTMPIELREKLAFDGPKLPAALNELADPLRLRGGHPQHLQPRRNLPRPRRRHDRRPDADLIAEFVAQFHQVPDELIRANRSTPAPTRKPCSICSASRQASTA